MWPYFSIKSLLLIVVVALNPAAATAQSDTDANGGDIYPPLWDFAPENLLDFPVKDNKIVINPWNYRERLGVYKSLLKASAKYFMAFGSQNSGNILWGLPLQHGWQFRTGRLADPTNGTSCGHRNLCISVRSWWSCMNYYLAIIPFLGAVEAGLFGEVQYEVEMLPPEDQRGDFCYSVGDCRSHIPKLMDEWKAYFEYLLSAEQRAMKSAKTYSFVLDDALHHMWKAHVASIAYALPKFRDRSVIYPARDEALAQLVAIGRQAMGLHKMLIPIWKPGPRPGAVSNLSRDGYASLKYLADPEANFGEDWANGVDFIAATHFSTDLQTTNNFQAFLPQRMLVEGDVLPSISDFSSQQNRVLLSLRALNKANRLTGGLLLKLWQKAMSTEAARKIGRKLIEDLASSPSFDPLGIYSDLKGADFTASSFLRESSSNTD